MPSAAPCVLATTSVGCSYTERIAAVQLIAYYRVSTERQGQSGRLGAVVVSVDVVGVQLGHHILALRGRPAGAATLEKLRLMLLSSYGAVRPLADMAD